MKSKQTLFFATIEDIRPILQKVEEEYSISYFKMGLLDTKDIPIYTSAFSIPNAGYVKYGDWNRIDSYLLVPQNVSLKIREIPQRKGGTKYAVDQMVNHESIELKPGGIFLEKERILVGGRVATISDSAFSTEIYKVFTSKIKKEFKKIGTFYVGKEAEEKLRNGWRLVTNEKSPKEYDLALS